MIRVFGIGVMGCADIAQRMVIPAIQSSPFFDLKAVASRTANKAQEYASRFGTKAIVGYDNLLNDPSIEVVYMPLPTGLHYEWAMKALHAGKHLLIEKSLAVSAEQAQHMVSLASEKQLLIMENFMFEFHSQMNMIFEILNRNQIGLIRGVRISFGFPPFKDDSNIRYAAELGGGALLDAGAYTLKLAQLLPLGTVSIKSGSLIISKSKGVDLAGDCHIVTDKGISVHTSFGFQHHYQCKLEIWGSEGRLVAHRIFTAGPGIVPRMEVEKGQEMIEVATTADNHFVNLLAHFAHCLNKPEDRKEEYSKLYQQAVLIEVLRSKAEKYFQD